MNLKVYITAIFIVFITFNIIYAEDGPGASQNQVLIVDRSGYLCGLPQILETQNETLQNTRNLHPELSEQLLKPVKLVHDIGDTLPFFTQNLKTNSFEQISAVCMHKTDKTYIFVEASEWTSEKVTQTDLENFHTAFELSTPNGSLDPNSGIKNILETTFGLPPNKSGDGYVYILIYDIKDWYDPPNVNTYVAGYFHPNDQGNGSYSNKKDLIYVDSDPGDPSATQTLGFIAHEYQHLLHYNQDPNESSLSGLWVNEGISEYASFLCGYGLENPSRFLRSPERSLTAFQQSGANTLIDYSKVALWTYYLGEKFGTSLVSAIVSDTKQSIAGVRSALTSQGINLSFEEVFSNFVVANYADNPNLGDNGYFGYSNINLPILAKISITHNIYPVDTKHKTLPDYSSAYFRFTGQDSTAILNFSGGSFSDIDAQIYKNGSNTGVSEILLNQNFQGQLNLNEIGNNVSEIILIPTSLGKSNSYSYFVTSEIEDISPPQIISGPNESMSIGNSVTIFWETDESATSIVEYGNTDSYGSVVQDTNLVSIHQIILNNLQTNTTYHYRVGSVDAKGNGPAYSLDFLFATNEIAAKSVITLTQTHSYGYQGRNLVRDTNGALHLIYHEIVGSRRFVYHIKTEDHGDSWSLPILIDESNYFGGMPSVAIDSSDFLHVAWHAQELSTSNYKIYYSRSANSGATWSVPIMVSKIVTGNDQLYAAITIDNNHNPHIVWNSVIDSQSNFGDVYHNFSLNGGNSWPDDKIISTGGERRCFDPTINITSSGKAWVFYTDGTFNNGTRFVYFTSSEDYGQWTTAQNVSNSGVLYDSFHSFVIDPFDQIHLVYSDNFTPGDIRIIYKRFADNIWDSPIPVARSITGGFVNYPNLSIDNQGDLYLVYRDDMTSPGLGKLIQKEPAGENPHLLKTADPNDKGEVFLTVNSNGSWTPASNISNDTPNSEYPELPKFLDNSSVDLIWMNELSTSANQIKYLHFDTKSEPILIPPQILSVSPAAGDTDVVYFRRFLEISAVFNQRMEVDSMIPENVIIKNSADELIIGEFSYLESQRKMTFIPTSNLTPSDLITVRITTNITNDSGIGLDGNKNGIAEGSPVDDYVWSFQTRAVDLDPPLFVIGILQNPVLTKYLDVYVVVSEYLSEKPILKMGNQNISLIQNNRWLRNNFRFHKLAMKPGPGR